MRAVGFFVESKKRRSGVSSVGEQNRMFLDYCTREGYEVAATFLETETDGAPGGFEQMLSFLRRDGSGFTIVAVESVAALGSDLGRAAMRLLAIEATGAKVVGMTDGREALQSIVEAWADRGDGTPVSERVRSAMRRKAVRGEALGRPPFGYRVGPRRKLELVPEEAQVIRYIFRLYLQEGLGVRRIAGRLNSEGIKTRRGGQWSMVTVRDILRNRVYLGTYSRFGVKVPGSHPALVSADDFRLVQDRLQSRNPATRCRTVEPFLLSGLARCRRCGSRMIGVTRRQRWTTRSGEERRGSYRYYQCQGRTNRSSCGYNTQRAAEFEQRARELLSEEALQPSRIGRAGNVDAYMLDLLAERERIEGRIKRNRRDLEQLVADAAHGHVSLDRVRGLGAPLVSEEESLDHELREAKARAAATENDSDRRRHLEEARERLIAEWEKLEFDELRLLLREVVDRIEVDGDDVSLFLRG